MDFSGSKIALFDLDNSLADYDSSMSRDLMSLMSQCEIESNQPNFWRLSRQPAHIRNRMSLIKNQPGWWLNLDRIEAGFEVLQMALDIGYNVQILTKGPVSHPTAWKEKLEWCQNQPELKGVPVHIVSDKSIVCGDVLYDDYPEYLAAWLTARSTSVGIMPVNPYNCHYKHDRMHKWQIDAADARQNMQFLLEEVYSRKSLI
jgi:5'(3')-deoxyribonucleotidase